MLTVPEWRSIGMAWTRQQCPLCDWHMDEPPTETTAEWVGDSMVMRVRQHSAVPAALAHIVQKHPDSAHARDILAAARRAVGLGEPAVESSVSTVVSRMIASLVRSVESEAVRRILDAADRRCGQDGTSCGRVTSGG